MSEDLDQVLEELQTREWVEPPAQFTHAAEVQDAALYEEAERDLEGFWGARADALQWSRRWDTVLDDSDAPFYRWFVGGKINASANCLDRHVQNGRGQHLALHWAGAEAEERRYTYAQLLEEVCKFANALKDLGVGKGDVVGVFLPMIPEVAITMLACARVGAVHNVVFGGFSPHSMIERMQVSEATVLVTADGARRKGSTSPLKPDVDDVIAEAPTIEKVVVVAATGVECPMQEGRDVWFHELVADAAPECEPEEMDAEDPLFILYSSGSTSKPKGILHTTGGYLTGVNWTTQLVFDLRRDTDVFWCTADVGWITGHSYLVYGPLSAGCTTVMFEGSPDYPSKDVLWDICERYGVTVFYTAPTLVRSAMKWGPDHPAGHDLSALRLLGSVGEPINPSAWAWLYHVIGAQRCPIVDTWWQTETGHILIAPLPAVTTTKPGSATLPLPGIAAGIFDDEGNELDEGQGNLVLKRPWPGMLRTLFHDDERYVETYWDKYGPPLYEVGDAAKRDSDGYFWIVGRTDDVINVSGHRLSTAEIEHALTSYEGVAEAAAAARSDEDKGQVVVAFVTLADGEGDAQLEAALNDHVSAQIGKFARPEQIVWASDLPKTRSGKIMRRILRNLAEGEDVGDTSTLAEPEVVSELEAKLADR